MIASHLYLERRKLILQAQLITQGVNPAILITSSSDASLSQSTAYVSADGLSTCNGRLTRLSWKVDMSRVLGDWWGKHRRFSIRLVSFVFMNHLQIYANTFNRWAVLKMSGLNWHQNFNPTMNQNDSRKITYMGDQQGALLNRNFTYLSSGSTPRMTFDISNGDRFADITLEWFQMEGATSQNPSFSPNAGVSYTYPLGSYVFEILQVDESDLPFEPQANHFIINK